jgi:hypothetical protein
MKIKTKIIPYEEDEQKALVQYLELKGYKFTAIPNSTYTKSWAVKMKNKAMGVKKGLPDLLIIIKGKLVFIEMKRKGNYPTSEQKEWIKELNKLDNIYAEIAYSCEEAIKVVEKYK